MNVYITSASAVSPQQASPELLFGSGPAEYTGDRLSCIEPDYAKLIDPKLIRRMSRIIKMGVAAAMDCLQQAGVIMPDAIITGTAYGCLEDTAVFLKKMVENHEEMLTPTAFIQSTHNTVGAQIALMLKCHQYNNTFVHRGFSFENALLDAVLLLKEQPALHVLAGCADEITETSHRILTRMGLYKREPVSNLALLPAKSKGTMAGEGAAFFCLTNNGPKPGQLQLEAVHTFYKPGTTTEIITHINNFLREQQADIQGIDLVLSGRNGDIQHDQLYDELDRSVFDRPTVVSFKQLCGEYPTATGFALWLACAVLKQQAIPEWLGNVNAYPKNIRRILVYNNYQNSYHSLFLISVC